MAGRIASRLNRGAMPSNSLPPLPAACDAPRYSVVVASKRVGIETPEDVRWRRVNTADYHNKGRLGCSCGETILYFDRYVFTFLSGDEEAYWMKQCRRCRTVFWDPA